MKWITLDTAIDKLCILPLHYQRDAPDFAGQGWFMHLEDVHKMGQYKAYPGVFSTSFAVQLLCRQKNPAASNSIVAITKGMDYLLNQFSDGQRVAKGEFSESKQTHKYKEVGHHDFSLTLKLCSILQASNALADIVAKHEDFGALLVRHGDALDEIADRLKNEGIRSTSGRRAELGWPWHFLGGGEVDPIPTCHVLLTLTDTSLRASKRWLVDYQQTVAYLISVLENDSVSLVNRVTVGLTLYELAARTGESIIPDSARECLVDELALAMVDLPNLPWQEVMHFQVPSRDGSLSHYKPWIWTFPRIEFAICFDLLDPVRSKFPRFQIAAQLVENINKNDGRVIFLHAAPPTLLASLRTVDFLSEFRKNNLLTVSGKITFEKERLLINIFGFMERHRNSSFIFIFSLLIAAIFPYQARYIVDARSMTISFEVLHQAIPLLFPVWPLWVALIGFLMWIHEGNFGRRLRLTVKDFLLAVFIRLIFIFLPIPK